MKKKLLAICVLACLFFTACGDQSNTEVTPKTDSVQNTTHETESSDAPAISASDYSTIDEYLEAATADLEKKSSAMVDAIALLAKSDAANITDEQVENAISFIRDTYPNYYDNDALMIKTMYYGNLLDYAFDDSDARSILGTDANQAVKYVYRGVESIEDDATQENLMQIQEDLNNIQ